MYKPNFCCECGERVLRERWRAWTSRRYCASCAKRFRRGWIAPFTLACALASVGFAFGRLLRPAPPPLTMERGALPLPALLVKQAVGKDSQTTDAATRDAGDGTNDPDSRASNDANAQGIGTRIAAGANDPNARKHDNAAPFYTITGRILF
jgi:hypothetical protein